MPKTYTTHELHRAYDELAVTRKRICAGCGGNERLSHSHLIPRSRRADLATNPLNIQYHCLASAKNKGCHERYESCDVATMKDFEHNFRIIHSLDREYFWLRIHKLDDYWKIRDISVWKRVRALLIELDKKEHANA